MAASAPHDTAEPGRSADPAAETSGLDDTLEPAGRAPWPSWRHRTLALAALLGCIVVFWLAHWVATTPFVDARWIIGPAGAPVLASSPLPGWQVHRGRSLVAVAAPGGAPQPVDAALLHAAPRWQVGDADRARQVAQREGLANLLAAGATQWHFADGTVAGLAPTLRGWAGLGWLFWPLCALAWLLALTGVAVLTARPRLANLPYAVMALCQAGNLLTIALETTPGLGLPPGVAAHGTLVRMALDGATGAAAVSALALHPTRLPGARWIAAAVWAVLAAWLMLARAGALTPLWWWAQGLCLALATAALLAAAASFRVEPHPQAMVLRRFAGVTLASLMLVTAAVALAAGQPLPPAVSIGAGAPIAWTLFIASLLLLAPLLTRSLQAPREFALLASVGTVATSLDLWFATAFALDAFASLALALAIALAAYGQARRWLLEHASGSSVPGTERSFELLYRAAREAQARPAHYPHLLKRLLRELFEPLAIASAERVPARTRVVGNGSALLVPVRGGEADGMPNAALLLRYARQGQRLFTLDDARLVDRVIEQMRRAVAYDRAVEQGRHEERLRIAQDLHDDIGARLLTLMYQAPTPEMENYLRHTLQDLKTLTRGLAAAEHRLSHAAVEWRADLTHRLAAAQAELGWTFACDRDLRLTVMQWSALTRVLRELVSNALYHGHATRVDVQLGLEGSRLVLQVADDGCGREPQSWAHGLGLGGVRKRVKQLGGQVQWRENEPRGIVCDVRLDRFGGGD